MVKRALVTGGTGFIGSHLVDRLLREGVAVTVLARRTSSRRWLEGKKVAVIEGDLADKNALAAAVRGQDYLFHAAGVASAADHRLFHETNIQGTANLMTAALAGGSPPARLVYLSSLEAVGPARTLAPVKEGAQARPVTAYGRSKLLAEELLREQADRLSYCIIRPPLVYGPRDPVGLDFFRLARRGLAIQIGFRPQYVSTLYVENLVEALWLGAIKPAAENRIYQVSDADTVASAETLQQAVAALTGKKRVTRVIIPKFLFWPLCLAAELGQRLTGRTFRLNLTRYVTCTQTEWLCDSVKIRADLGFQPPFTLAAGLQQTWQWYKEQNWI